MHLREAMVQPEMISGTGAMPAAALRATGTTTMYDGLSEAPASHQTRANGADLARPAAIPADRNGQRALERGYIQLFLSHKQKDQRSAAEIREVLQTFGGRLQVFMSENIAKGADWQEEIEQQLHQSDWFVLLFSGVEDDDWSWCHHEAGIFRGMMYPDAERVVVFHPPNVALPDPLRRYQAVRCQEDHPGDLHRFFEELFGREPYPGVPPINPFFVREAGTARQIATDRIIRAVGRLVVDAIEPAEVLTLHVPSRQTLLEQDGFPSDARIRRGSGALALFELGDAEFAWRDFQAALDPELRERLAKSFWPAVHRACVTSARRHRLASTHAVMHSPADGRHYMPMLSRIETAGDDSATFHITFVHVAAGTQEEVRDKSVARIFTALNLSHRVRWEIIDRYRDPQQLREFVERHRGTEDERGGAAGALDAIWRSIRLLEIEAENRGVYDLDALPADFGPAAEARVRAMFPLWGELRERLQRAAAAGDVVAFAQGLGELDPINVEFISLASTRLGELVRADARGAG
jgi:hypothetical protein